MGTDMTKGSITKHILLGEPSEHRKQQAGCLEHLSLQR